MTEFQKRLRATSDSAQLALEQMDKGTARKEMALVEELVASFLRSSLALKSQIEQLQDQLNKVEAARQAMTFLRDNVLLAAAKREKSYAVLRVANSQLSELETRVFDLCNALGLSPQLKEIETLGNWTYATWIVVTW